MQAYPKDLGPSPPEKGSFPLDRQGECKDMYKEYMQCLRENGGNNDNCKPFSKRYLECRMQKNLMAPEDLGKLGFKTDEEYAKTPKVVVKERRISPDGNPYTLDTIRQGSDGKYYQILGLDSIQKRREREAAAELSRKKEKEAGK